MRAFCLILCLVPAHVLSAADKPNIVLIIADDMGYSDLGCYGGEIETPNLDGLAESGLRFTNFYVNNMCWPTRASLMTGLYPKTALPKNGSANGGLHPRSQTLPQALRASGYTTLMSGKWHLSNAKEPDGPNAPQHRGFDHFYGTIHGASDFFAPADVQLDGKDMTHEWRNNPDYYYTDAITDHALQFLKQRDEKPFFLYLAYTSAHWPLHARPEDIDHYQGRFEDGWDELRAQRHSRMKQLGVVNPDWPLSPRHSEVPAWEDAPHNEWQQRRMEVYAAQVTCMDRNIGRVVNYLKETHQFENTLVLYMHDNGGCHVEYGPKRTGSWTRQFTTDGKQQPITPGNLPEIMPGPQTTFQSYGYGWANLSNTPFRLFKQHDHEGGTRSPLIVSWPAGIDRDRAGGLSHQLGHAIDIMPTLLAVTDSEIDRQQPIPFEGRSLREAIVNLEDHADSQRTLFWSHARGKAVRDADWKLVSQNKQAWELYHLSQDGTELNDLAAEFPQRVEEFTRLFSEWERRTNPGAGSNKKPKSESKP